MVIVHPVGPASQVKNEKSGRRPLHHICLQYNYLHGGHRVRESHHSLGAQTGGAETILPGASIASAPNGTVVRGLDPQPPNRGGLVWRPTGPTS